jgi:hypothetical protein
MNQHFLDVLNEVTPRCDKVMPVVGGFVATILTLGNVQVAIGILVGVLTLIAAAQRIMIGHIEMKEKLRAAEKAKEEERE